MRILGLCAPIAAAMISILPAHAQEQSNPYGYDQIATNNLKGAEKRLLAQSAEEPDEPSVLINLAYVYQRTGRAADARALYERVLAQPDVLMALGNGKPAWSHAIALKATGRSTDFAAR